MSVARRLFATSLVPLILLACSACDRAEPDAAFRELTEPFTEVSRDCWPFGGAAPFTTPWFADAVDVEGPNATLTAEVFEADAVQVTSELAALPDVVVTPADGEGPVRVTITGPSDAVALTGCTP